jgi:hypothetical protein
MAIITKPNTINKGEPATFTLNKADLLAHPSVSGDAYFADSDNWRSVYVEYRSSIGNQRELLVFDAQAATPQTSFLVSLTARDEFDVRRIVINDFDGGKLFITRSELDVEDFDVVLEEDEGGGGGGEPVLEDAILWGSKAGYTSEPDGGLTSSFEAISNTVEELVIGQSFEGGLDYEVIFNYNGSYGNNAFLGIATASLSTFTGISNDSTITRVYFGNNVVLNLDAISGPGILVLKRASDIFTITLNGVEVYNVSLLSGLDTLVPVTRFPSAMYLESAYVVV